MIESIEIKNVASYDLTGVTISGLRRVNFIYGSNGTGKTTISNFLHDQEDERFPDCEVIWKGNDRIDTLVYNKEFRERNFGKGVVDGVFTLGEATTEQIEEINRLKIKRDEIRAKIIDKRAVSEKLKSQIDNEKQEFKEYVWRNAFKKHEGDFREAFRGVALNKEPFMNEFLKQFKDNKASILSKEELVEKATTLLGVVPTKLDAIPTLEIDDLLKIENNPIWKKRIIGKTDVDIAKLIQRLNISDWVYQGRDYIESDDPTCPFCQKPTIDSDFRSQLNDFFDEEFIENNKDLKLGSEAYRQITSLIVETLRSVETSQADLKEQKINLNKFSPLLKSIEVQIESVIRIIESKLKEPSRSVELPSIKKPFEEIIALIVEANKGIQLHNKMVLNYQDEKAKLVDEIWRFYIEQEKTKLDGHTKKIEGLSKALKTNDSLLDELKKEWHIKDQKIKERNRNVTSVQPTVDEINRLLMFYGFLNFKIVPLESDPNQYQILREDGSLAEDTLSEGEITFITLLYFIQRIKGGLSEETVDNDRVVVIDDPISSLDSSVLFIISSLIKELIKKVKKEEGNIKQVILLTHNVYFHKEVSYEGSRPKGGERPYFWILRKKDMISGIHCYEENNPIHSSYELLWNELRNWQNSSGITIQNVMRRILENYYSILGNKRDDTIINSFSTYEEQEICRSLLSWTNEGSHTLPDDLLIEMPDETIEKYLKVFKAIFKKTQNIGHYSMMMKEELAEAV